MTKEDYILIAKVLHDVRIEELPIEPNVLHIIVDRLSEKLKLDNDKFDAVKFNKAIYKE